MPKKHPNNTKTAVFLFLTGFSILVISCASPVRSYQKALEKAPYDVIIVPGVPFEQQNRVSNVMKERVLWSYFLYSRGITRNVIYSGNAVYSPYIEGRIMAMYAIALGIPPEHVFSETRAEHSTENLVYSCQMAVNMGFNKIALATDPFQSNALRSYAWDCHIRVTFIPILYDSLATFRPDSLIRVDPSAAFVPGFIPLPERENWFKRVTGTMGLRINEDLDTMKMP